MGGVGNGAAEEDGRWDLNLVVAAVPEEGPCGFGVLLFATWLKQQERLCQEEKGRKDSY